MGWVVEISEMEMEMDQYQDQSRGSVFLGNRVDNGR